MPISPFTEEEVLPKLGFAVRRMNDMRALNSGNFPGAPAAEKHQLGQGIATVVGFPQPSAF
jgi:hypothetical protein